MHYAEFKQHDPSLVLEMVKTFPFATILVNGDKGPLVAQAPLTPRTGQNSAGAVEFHLALVNPIAKAMIPDVPITIMVQGPGAAISPSWYTASFQGENQDRSQTAPTYNYLSLVIRGRLELIDDLTLQNQIRDLVLANEPANGWRTEELDPQLWNGWRKMIQGYRLEIAEYDLTAKISQGDSPGDKPGLVEGLKQRNLQQDGMMAKLVGGYDGTPSSLHALLRNLREQ
ncbi:FMN-binding negative transcriptional regulator [Rheinheimera hassiensis]|uniref:FMN-binding negative transcriptional regulator n=1 Tax=Rheinheimera hassiensis TaxID=1193627 RepID=UPI001F069A54|nr:FMN-binding negative transcriptional regulator [Rheinheimera hassiensis]